jgi:hypothetical protein
VLCCTERGRLFSLLIKIYKFICVIIFESTIFTTRYQSLRSTTEFIASARTERKITKEEDGMVVVIDKDFEQIEVIKVIPVPESTPPRSPYKQTTRIWIGPRGRPTGTLAPKERAREAGPDSPEAGSVVWPPLPPPPLSGPVTTTPPPQDPTAVSEHHLSGAPSEVESFAASPTS